jgi:dimethylargininase
VALALTQHARYCAALEQCGLALTRLPADPRHPDSTFVEDAAVITSGGAVLARPGAPSRLGEVKGVAEALGRFFPRLRGITPTGTLDGGDVCEAGEHFYIGISRRTNEEGARQLAAILAEEGRTASLVDIRDVDGILHLKSGLAWLGGRRLAVWDTLAGHPGFRGWELLHVGTDDRYAANCVLVNGRLLVAAGHPGFETALRELGHEPLVLDMSEFRKMDGGLSCLSLRFQGVEGGTGWT